MSLYRTTFSIDDGPVAEDPPRTWVVLLLLVSAAAAMSFLASYGLSTVLVRVDLISAWQDGTDPRPRWMAIGFVVLLGGFGLIGGLARYFSQLQLRRIDRIAD